MEKNDFNRKAYLNDWRSLNGFGRFKETCLENRDFWVYFNTTVCRLQPGQTRFGSVFFLPIRFS